MKVDAMGHALQFTAFYGSPREEERKALWDWLDVIAGTTLDQWLVAGDFNEIADVKEKKEGNAATIGTCRVFGID
ncbi:hypothetical protein QN277_003549 [Acacia crassicarpa]|uniref:Uncharacterized protein n=1 Tax=Acacia crassicarpa TaxID=499986 RepID=A0AAE1JW23_9FABA|nr:hypothetical protein QN277_003549 [Acacia crassicarpa]